MHARRLFGLLVLLPLIGCTTTGGFSFLPAEAPPVACVSGSCGTVLMPTPAEVDIDVESVHRGVRGGSLVLRLHNDSADKALLLDWSKISLRLGSGQFRRCLSDEEFFQLALEFSFPAYGWDQEALGHELPDLVYPKAGEIDRLKPGEAIGILLHFGAPQAESKLLVSLNGALTWETIDGQRLGPVQPAVRCTVDLPSLTEAKPSTWWPDWLHVGVFVTNGL